MQSVHFIVYLAAGWLLVGSFLRFHRARPVNAAAADLPERLQLSLPIFLNFIAALFISISLFLGAGLFFQGSLLTSIFFLASAILIASAADLVVSVRSPLLGLLPKNALIAPALAVAVGLGVLIFTAFLRSAPGGFAESLNLDYPVKGGWKVAAGGRSRLTNYHHNKPASQNFAVDIICYPGDSEGEKIYAPVDGEIVMAFNDREQGSPEPEGNLIIMKTKDGTEIWFAHLKQNSLRVKDGDPVTRGQELAECGATGSALTAHLHIHAQKNDRAVPMVLGGTRKFLLRNDRFVN